MEVIIEILNRLNPGVDYAHQTALVYDGILTSVMISALCTEINDRLDVKIPAQEIVPDNFNTVEAIWALVQRLDDV